MSEKMSENTNALNWFEIPATDIERATKYYETIFDLKLVQIEMMGMKMAMFPTNTESARVGGGLCQSEMHVPSKTGALIYLNANPDLQLVLDRIEKVNGNITLPKTEIGGNGYMAFFEDSEGNIVGLHSND
jgi:predicted enzyme related to lactoylglutathione lyase